MALTGCHDAARCPTAALSCGSSLRRPRPRRPPPWWPRSSASCARRRRRPRPRRHPSSGWLAAARAEAVERAPSASPGSSRSRRRSAPRPRGGRPRRRAAPPAPWRSQQRQGAPAGARGRDRVHGERGALPGAQARDVAAHAPAVAERAGRRGHEQARGRPVAEAHGHGAVAARAPRHDTVGHGLAHARDRRRVDGDSDARRAPDDDAGDEGVVGRVGVGRERARHDHALEGAGSGACAP